MCVNKGHCITIESRKDNNFKWAKKFFDIYFYYFINGFDISKKKSKVEECQLPLTCDFWKCVNENTSQDVYTMAQDAFKELMANAIKMFDSGCTRIFREKVNGRSAAGSWIYWTATSSWIRKKGKYFLLICVIVYIPLKQLVKGASWSNKKSWLWHIPTQTHNPPMEKKKEDQNIAKESKAIEYIYLNPKKVRHGRWHCPFCHFGCSLSFVSHGKSEHIKREEEEFQIYIVELCRSLWMSWLASPAVHFLRPPWCLTNLFFLNPDPFVDCTHQRIAKNMVNLIFQSPCMTIPLDSHTNFLSKFLCVCEPDL